MADIDLRVRLDANRADSTTRRLGKTFEQTSRQARRMAAGIDVGDRSIDKLRRSLFSVQGVLATFGVSLGLGAIARQILEVNTEFEKLRAQLTTTQGSLEAGVAAFAAIEQLAVETPFQIEELTQAFIGLRVRGAEPTREELFALGDLAAAFGRDITDVADAIASATAGETEPIRRLGFEASIAGDRISLAFGGASQVVTRSADAITAAIVQLTSDQVGGSMERLMQTISGRASNLEDTLGALARAIGEAGLNREVQNLLGGLDDFASKLIEGDEAAQDFARTVQQVIGFTKLLGGALVLPITALGTLGATIAGTIGIVISQSLLLFESALNGVIDGLNRVGDLGRGIGIDIPDVPLLDFSFAEESLGESVDFMVRGFDLLRGNIDFIAQSLEQMSGAGSTALSRVTPSLEGVAGAARQAESEFAAANRELDDLLNPPTPQLAQSMEQVLRIIREVAPVTQDASDAVEQLTRELLVIDVASRAAGGVINSIDGIDDSARRAIGGVLDLVRALKQIELARELEGVAATLGTISGVGAGIGALISIGSSIFGGGDSGPSEAELERNRLLESNNDALERLRVSLSDFRLTSDVLFRGLEGIPNVLRGDRLLATRPGQPGFFEQLGLSPIELAGLGEEFGIQLRDDAGRFIPAAFDQLRQAILATIPELTGFADTLAGIQQERDIRDRILGIERTPEQQAAAIFGDLKRVAPDLFQEFFAGIDLTDSEALRRATLGAFDAFAVGGDAFAAMMGDLTREDLIMWFDRAAGSIEAFDKAVEATTNAIRNVPAWFRVAGAVLNAADPDPINLITPPPPPISHPVPTGPLVGPRDGRSGRQSAPAQVTIGPITVVQQPGEDGERVARRTAELVKREFERENLARTGSRHGNFTL